MRRQWKLIGILFLVSSVMVVTSRSADDVKPRPQDLKLEYCLHFASPFEMSSDFSKTLDTYGNENWDLTAVVVAGTEPRNDISPGHVQSTSYMFVFKRSAVGAAKSCGSIHAQLEKRDKHK